MIMKNVFDQMFSKLPGDITLAADLLRAAGDQLLGEIIELSIAFRQSVICDTPGCTCNSCVDRDEVYELINIVTIRIVTLINLREGVFQLQLTSQPGYRAFWTNSQSIGYLMPSTPTR